MEVYADYCYELDQGYGGSKEVAEKKYKRMEKKFIKQLGSDDDSGSERP